MAKINKATATATAQKASKAIILPCEGSLNKRLTLANIEFIEFEKDVTGTGGTIRINFKLKKVREVLGSYVVGDNEVVFALDAENRFVGNIDSEEFLVKGLSRKELRAANADFTFTFATSKVGPGSGKVGPGSGIE